MEYYPLTVFDREVDALNVEYARITASFTNESVENNKALDLIKLRLSQIQDAKEILMSLGLGEKREEL